ncbi:MAG: ATP-binding protein, partial [Thermoplasmata archaeon]
ASNDVQSALQNNDYKTVTNILMSKFNLGDISAVKILTKEQIDIETHPVFEATAKSIAMDMESEASMKGTLLVGVPGAGKTVFAKTLAKMTNSMLVEIDLGNLLGSLVGESEKNAEKLFQFLSYLKPAVILIDELDKLVSNGSSRDSSVMNNIKVKLLKWLEIPKSGQYVIATANNMDLIPPELARQGRWDYVFKVPPPPRDVRSSIVEYYARKYNLPVIRELIDGGSVTVGNKTINIQSDLVTPSDISSIYENIHRMRTGLYVDLGKDRISLDALIKEELVNATFNYYSESWMISKTSIDSLNYVNIYDKENSIRRILGMKEIGDVKAGNNIKVESSTIDF